MSEYLERTNASKPTFGDYVTLEMKCYGVPNEYFIHEVMTHPFTSNSWRNVPIDARDPEEHLHDTSETVISVCTQGFHLSGWHIFNVRLSDVLPMKGDKWAWQESPLRTRIAELEAYIDQLIEAGSDLALIAKDIFEFDGESGEFTPIAEKWQALVKDWKEREE